MSGIRKFFADLAQYPSAVAGMMVIGFLIMLSIYTLITVPYDEAVRLWRGGERVWYQNPKNAPPAWINWFREPDLPQTMILNSADGDGTKSREVISQDMTDVIISLPFEYPYSSFPKELTIYFTSNFQEKQPFVSVYLLTPDGREIQVGDLKITSSSYTYRISQDDRLIRRLAGNNPEQALFADPETLTPLPGQYELQIRGLVFEEEADIDAEFVIMGRVQGMAGTDHLRRDLVIALLWGTPIALSFGLLAAVGTTVTTMLFAAIGVWYGGWVDGLIQRVTEVNLVLPLLSILIMVGTFYSRKIWLMLGVVILLSIFGAGIKTYRAIFLQTRESPYIEAARAYGASNWRIIVHYLIPRIVPVLLPQLVTLIPSYVFLEASLAVLGLGDPILPTWGKVIDDARSNGALYQGHYYWMLQPAVLLMFTGIGFSMVGFALDRIFNPRLRGL